MDFVKKRLPVLTFAFSSGTQLFFPLQIFRIGAFWHHSFQQREHPISITTPYQQGELSQPQIWELISNTGIGFLSHKTSLFFFYTSNSQKQLGRKSYK